MDEKKLQALARKNAAKATQPKVDKTRHKFDDTLPPEDEKDLDRRDFFSEMKKREF